MEAGAELGSTGGPRGEEVCEVDPVVGAVDQVEVGLAGELVEPCELVTTVRRARPGDAERLAEQVGAVVPALVEQVVEGLSGVLQVTVPGGGERLADRVVVPDVAEGLVSGRHRYLSALHRGRLRGEDRLPEVAAGRAGNELQPVRVVLDVLAVADRLQHVHRLVGRRGAQPDRETPRLDGRDQFGGLTGGDHELGRSVVLLHHAPKRLLEVLADRLGVVQKHRLVLAGHRRVGGRLREHVIYHVAFGHPALPREEPLEPGVRPDLLFRSAEEVRDVDLDQVALGRGVRLSR